MKFITVSPFLAASPSRFCCNTSRKRLNHATSFERQLQKHPEQLLSVAQGLKVILMIQMNPREKAETVYALYRLSYCPKGQAGLEPATTSLIEVTVSYASGITLLSLLPLQLSTFLSIFPAVPPW
jgi:hypothetical protein